MGEFVNLARELCLCVVDLARSFVSFIRLILIILLMAIALALYLIYLAVNWVAAHPIILMGLLVVALSVFWLRRYVLGREVVVERDCAAIVRRAGGGREPLYQGRHRLKIGDRICEWLSLRPRSEEMNQEEAFTRDEEPVRISAVCEMHIYDPLRFYQARRPRRKLYAYLAELNRWALATVVEDFGFDELYNSPFEINRLVAQTINDRLRDRGLQVINYRMDEVIWPETNERWKRNRSYLALQAGQYWSDSRNLKRQLR
jgi:regulator of protease activity HflC (stomatin/prohibitin superfamily)